MSTREVKTLHEITACDVCGRTLLRGEHAETWLAGGQRRQVCDLCEARARHEGWAREDPRFEMTDRSPDGERRISLLDRLRGLRVRNGRVDEEQRAEPEEPANAFAESDGAELVEEPATAASPAPRPRPRTRDSASREAAPREASREAAPREPRDVHAIPTSPEHRVAAALDVFNGTEHVKTVAGVARSLGRPTVAARALPDSSRVSVTVSWELCWYRYEVELAHERGSVHQVAQGYELDELPFEDLRPTAAADDDGRLRPAA
jgi:hypothetical protein